MTSNNNDLITYDCVNKHPIGVAPHWFVYEKRMEELSDAIKRYLVYARDNRYAENMEGKYRAIAGWSNELKVLANLEAECELEEQHER